MKTKAIYFLCVLLSILNTSSSQVNISGVINDYTPVVAIIPCNAIVVQDASAFSVGDKVLIIQMQGAAIDSVSNNSSFGQIINYGSTGNYEFNTIIQISGTTITFQSSLIRSYDPGKKVQLVRVPQYTNANVSSNLTCAAWDGSIGGVLVFEATDSVTLNADIDVTGKGFRGGLTFQNQVCPGCATAPNYFYSLSADVTGEKGEGIFLNLNPNFAGGKGAIANGGGSGSCKNGGGGGGSNIGSGGIGGLSFNGCGTGMSPAASGIGGYAIDSIPYLNKVFLGGGGGGGDSDDPIPVGTDGVAGGGIIIIKANFLVGNGFSISANGASQLLDAGNDGAGGGGGGGSMLLAVDNYAGVTNVNALGGNGGNNNSTYPGYCHAPGGGGGGGLVWLSQGSAPAGLVVSVVAGNAGNILNSTPSCAGTTYGAGNGASGSSLYNLQFPVLPIILTSLNSNAPICINDTLNLFVNTIVGATYMWTGPNSFSSFQQNPQIFNFSIADTGYYIVQIQFNGCTYATDSILVNSFGTSLAPLINSTNPVCEGDTISMTSNAVSGIFYWSGPNGFQSSASNPIIPNATLGNSGVYSLYLDDGGCLSDTAFVSVSINQIPAPPFINSNSPICEGDTLQLNSSASGNVVYHWFGANNFQSSLPSPSINNVTLNDSGSYHLYIEIGGCSSDTVDASLSINSAPATPLISSNSPICIGDTLILSAVNQINTDYSWTGPNGFNSSVCNPSILNVIESDSGIYALVINESGCESNPAILNVSINSAPALTLSDVVICNGERLIINLPFNNNSNYLTTGPNGFNSIDNNIIINNIETSEEGIYIVAASNTCGSAEDSMLLTVINSIESQFLPNSFTPNGDTRNDVYEIDNIQIFKMSIYNRWGQLIVELNENQNIWDGHFLDKMCQDEVYVYLFEGKNCKGEDVKRTGSITIMR